MIVVPSVQGLYCFRSSAGGGWPNRLPVKFKTKLLLIHDAPIDCGSGFQPRFIKLMP
ncbi:hypothetical protein D1AOALGA4SA_11880 [Olavius algarvensis Delta 1 endosymbiont]|nr:hypothetical protein D1AOALGA4SA_11880 [Olavius algarvensis Delta 1 endosymbiont]